MEEVIKKKFQVDVNKHRYDVYPLFETMVDKTISDSTKQIVDNVFEGKSIPIARRVILYHYFDAFLKNVNNLRTS
jgi:hypothetical protein